MEPNLVEMFFDGNSFEEIEVITKIADKLVETEFKRTHYIPMRRTSGTRKEKVSASIMSKANEN